MKTQTQSSALQARAQRTVEHHSAGSPLVVMWCLASGLCALAHLSECLQVGVSSDVDTDIKAGDKVTTMASCVKINVPYTYLTFKIPLWLTLRPAQQTLSSLPELQSVTSS